MTPIIEGFQQAFKMIFSLDKDLLNIISVSLKVSLTAIILTTSLALPVGFFLALKKIRGKRVIITIINSLMALPTVVVGLFIYSMISRQGPFGASGILYTPQAMVIGQTILAFPIITGLVISAIKGIDRRVEKTALTLGANKFQTLYIILSEGRIGIMYAIIAGFGRIFAEVGVSMMLGGNIRGFTRNITTAIAFETGKGEFALGIALGIILLTIAFSINLLLQYFQGVYTTETK